MRDYSIDHKTGTITYTDHAGRVQDASITDVLELFFWLRSREDDIRRMVYNFAPVTVSTPIMRLEGAYYVGVTEDRYLVKVDRARYEQEVQAQNTYIRARWMEAKKQAKEDQNRIAGKVYHLVRYNAIGQEIPPEQEPELTLDDCPDEIVQAHMQRVYSPSWWVNRHDNLTLGIRLKLP